MDAQYSAARATLATAPPQYANIGVLFNGVPVRLQCDVNDLKEAIGMPRDFNLRRTPFGMGSRVETPVGEDMRDSDHLDSDEEQSISTMSSHE